MGIKSGSGSGMNNPDHISESLETFFIGLKYLNFLMRIRDPNPGSGINIQDLQHWEEEEEDTDVLALPGKRAAYF
jgi:hypothetical protein